MRLVWDRPTSPGNPRNSEGSFIRLPDESILFAYSRYSGDSWQDHANCCIAGIRSFDEGESWTEPEILVQPDFFGVTNIMSASAIYQEDGAIGLYFLIKESAGNITFGRAISPNGVAPFVPERCEMQAPLSYYVMNNDRLHRFSDGNLYAPVAMHAYWGYGKADPFSTSTVLISRDDGKTFVLETPCRIAITARNKSGRGLQEPGIIEHKDGSVRLWARTTAGFQYEAWSRDHTVTFSDPAPSVFTSPGSPLQMVENGGEVFAVYNPTPSYNGHFRTSATANRTPLVIRKSVDDGRSWTDPVAIEADPQRGYCYPALFFTKDDSILVAYCRGGLPEEEFCLQRLGISKLRRDEV
ncbi:MAG: exo-alpha-sialidase [Clostridia bacterium]|nr:exo-alpha-sialidase [Clostridia bacterium]